MASSVSSHEDGVLCGDWKCVKCGERLWSEALGKCTTANGALSNDTTNSFCLDYFFKCRGADVNELIIKAWNENPLTTLKLMFYIRDCRGGKGEKKLFYDSFISLYNFSKITGNDTTITRRINYSLYNNLKHIPEYGSWKDIVKLYESIENLDFVSLIKGQLEMDLKAMNEGKTVSLCAKWLPSASTKLGIKLAKELFVRDGMASKKYRTIYLTPLRAYINIVERLMCSRKWDEIDFSKVPSQAMQRLKKAFKKHTPEKFAAWLKCVIEGKSKVCAKQLFPYQLVGGYERLDDLVEEQWKVISNSVKCSLENTVIVVDTSGSMLARIYNNKEVSNLDIATSLGLLVAENTLPPFKNTVITFSKKPTLVRLDHQFMFERLCALRNASWQANTNLQAVFNLIIDELTITKITTAPKRIIIISDMQFDSANGKYLTNFEAIKEQYSSHNLVMPQLVFWNVAGATNDFPAKKNDAGVVLISGFSQSLLDMVIEDVVSPMNIMKKAINNPRYDRITLY